MFPLISLLLDKYGQLPNILLRFFVKIGDSYIWIIFVFPIPFRPDELSRPVKLEQIFMKSDLNDKTVSKLDENGN